MGRAKTTSRRSKPKAAPRPEPAMDPTMEISEPDPDAGAEIDPEPKVAAAAPKTEHKGRFRVLSQIKFVDPDGKVRYQLPYEVIPGDQDEGTGPVKTPAYLQCPTDISEEQVQHFFRNGCLEPHFE